jgi:hypothetical protein
MELYPFIDSLWYGEGFDYDNATPDYWLAEISGLLLGLTGEMLRYPGMTPMHFRGLAHGMTNRWQHSYKTWEKSTACVEEFAVSPGCDPFDPRDIWALQREFGIERSKMIGWWEDVLAVQSNVENVKVTTYVRSGKSALIVLANFGKEVGEVTLEFDWELLGLKDWKRGGSTSASSQGACAAGAGQRGGSEGRCINPAQGSCAEDGCHRQLRGCGPAWCWKSFKHLANNRKISPLQDARNCDMEFFPGD